MIDIAMNADRLLAHFEQISEAPGAIPRLRRFILDLAVRGKLVVQDPEDEPAEGLRNIFKAEKTWLVETGQIRKPKQLSEVNPDDYPKVQGWNWEQLGCLSTVITKGSTPTSYGHAYTNAGVNFVKVESIKDGALRPSTINSFISTGTHDFLSRSRLEAGDILFSIAGSIGTCAIVDETILPANTNQALAIIRGTQMVFSPGFLLLVLRSSLAQSVLLKARGVAMNNVSLNDIQNLVVPLPPLAEQHRIVAKVDELMALCDQLEAARQQREQGRERLVAATLQRLNQPAADPASFRKDASFALQVLPSLTTTPAPIKQLRQTILNLAVRGKLVEQDPEDEPVEELLAWIAADRKLLSSSKSKNQLGSIQTLPIKAQAYSLPCNWAWVRFGDIIYSRDVERVPVSKDERSRLAKSYDYYGASGVIDKIDRYLFDKPLLLIGEDGANLLNRSTPIAFIARGKYWVNNHAHVLDGISEEFLRFLELTINATDLSPYVTGTAQPKMNQAKMNSIPVALPPLAEQHRIVAKVDELMALCDQLEQQLSQADQQRRRLLEAVLAEALVEPEQALAAMT